MEIVSPGIGLIFWMLIIFSLLFFVATKFIWPAILTGLKQREQEISDSLDEARRTREQMAALKADNEALLKQAKEERDAIIREARMLKEKMLDEAKEQSAVEGQRLIEEAKKRIEQEKMAAITEVKNQVADLSIQIAEKLIRAELSDKHKNAALMDKLIAEANTQLN